jgi:hypothetical protein
VQFDGVDVTWVRPVALMETSRPTMPDLHTVKVRDASAGPEGR